MFKSLKTQTACNFVNAPCYLGSISAALSCPVYVPPRKESSGKERGLFSRTAAGNRAYMLSAEVSSCSRHSSISLCWDKLSIQSRHPQIKVNRELSQESGWLIYKQPRRQDSFTRHSHENVFHQISQSFVWRRMAAVKQQKQF